MEGGGCASDRRWGAVWPRACPTNRTMTGRTRLPCLAEPAPKKCCAACPSVWLSASSCARTTAESGSSCFCTNLKGSTVGGASVATEWHRWRSKWTLFSCCTVSSVRVTCTTSALSSVATARGARLLAEPVGSCRPMRTLVRPVLSASVDNKPAQRNMAACAVAGQKDGENSTFIGVQ
eukprot:6189217-Pleurochrysis_carterae.AAC.4